MRFHSLNHRSRRIVPTVIVCAIFLLPPASLAQNPTGSLRGEVQDVTRGRIPSASVIVRSLATSLERQATADSRGEFRINDLSAGTYRVVVSAHGFADASSDITVLVSNVRDILVTLRPAQVQLTVNVKAEPSSITTQELDTTDAVNGGVVSGKDLETIPLAARSFANIAYMVPGTEPVEPSDPTKA